MEQQEAFSDFNDGTIVYCNTEHIAFYWNEAQWGIRYSQNPEAFEYADALIKEVLIESGRQVIECRRQLIDSAEPFGKVEYEIPNYILESVPMTLLGSCIRKDS